MIDIKRFSRMKFIPITGKGLSLKNCNIFCFESTDKAILIDAF